MAPAAANQFGYHDFTLGDFSFRRDEYFAHLKWPGGSHIAPVDKFLKAVHRRWDANIEKEEVETPAPTGKYQSFEIVK